MTPIRLVIAVFYKFKILVSDRQLFAAMVLVPVLITSCIGFTIKNEKLDTIPVAFVDEDGTDYSRAIIGRISAKEGLNVTVTDRANARALLGKNEVEQVYVVRKGFKSAIKKGEGSGLIEVESSPLSHSSGFTRELVAGEVMRLLAADMAANDVVRNYKEIGTKVESNLPDDVKSYVNMLWEPEPLMTVTYMEMRAGKVEENNNLSFFNASSSSIGLLVAFIMFYMLYGSGWLIEERANGTIDRVAVIKGAVFVSFIGNVIAVFVVGLLQILLFGAVLKFIFGVELFSGILSYLLLFSYLSAAVSISTFLSSVFGTRARMQAVAPLLALFTGFVGGCFWNHIAMPKMLRFLALLTPQGWILRGLNNASSGAPDLPLVLMTILVLFAILLILLPASYIIIYMRLKRT